MSKDLHKNELTRLINRGFPFQIEVTTKRRNPGIFGYFQSLETIKETKEFVIKEPTLATLDRIALLSLDIDPEKHKDEQDFNNYLKKNNRLHYKIMARIIAVSVAEEEDEEKELTELFYKCLKPSELYQIMQVADLASNHTDFMNSTLLVTAAQAHTARTETVEERLQDLKLHMEDAE